MKIVFMGTPEFAVQTLKMCIENHHVVGVFTQPDKPKGRGKSMAAPPIKEVALAYDIPVFQPEKIKSDNWVEKIKELAPECIVVVAYGQILSQAILDIPKYGCINVHASLLPKLRGAAPINWAIVRGEEISGVTTMMMDSGLDTGDMLLKREIEIHSEMTAGELHDKLSLIGADALVETLDMLEKNEVKREKQDNSLSSYAPILDKKLSRINWELSAREIDLMVRGFNPWPVAYTEYQDKAMKIFKSRPVKSTEINLNLENVDYGTVVDIKKDQIIVKTGDGVLELLEIQWGSGKRMPVGAFLLGHSMEIGAKFI